MPLGTSYQSTATLKDLHLTSAIAATLLCASMIRAHDVSKWFGPVQAVRGVSFEIDAGQVVGLLGPNGAGKTTTIRMITGYLPPSSGAVSVCGHDTIAQSLPARRSLGYLPESAPLYPEMRVEDFLHFRGRLYGLARGPRRAAVDGAMDRCWLRDVRRRRIGHLSKGYRQRVGLASALLHSPPVLVLDEPTSGLDPAQIRQTRTLIRDLSHRRTVLVSSHILPEVEKTCDRVIVMARGRVRADGAPADLLRPLADTSPYIVDADTSAPRTVESVLSLLKAVAGVARVVRTPAAEYASPRVWAEFHVTPAPGAPDLREAIARSAAGAGVLVRDLHRRTPTLEQLFLRVIEEDDAA